MQAYRTGIKKKHQPNDWCFVYGQMPSQLLHELLLKLLLIRSLDDLISSFHRRLSKCLTGSQFTNRTGFVKLLLKTLKRLIDRFVFFNVDYDHSCTPPFGLQMYRLSF